MPEYGFTLVRVLPFTSEIVSPKYSWGIEFTRVYKISVYRWSVNVTINIYPSLPVSGPKRCCTIFKWFFFSKNDWPSSYKNFKNVNPKCQRKRFPHVILLRNHLPERTKLPKITNFDVKFEELRSFWGNSKKVINWVIECTKKEVFH